MALTACGAGKGDADRDAGGENQAPTFLAGWTERPTLRQGTELLLTGNQLSDPDGDAVTVIFSTGDPGLAASLSGDGSVLRLHADYDVSGIVSVTMAIQDARGATAMGRFDVEVRPIGWLSADT